MCINTTVHFPPARPESPILDTLNTPNTHQQRHRQASAAQGSGNRQAKAISKPEILDKPTTEPLPDVYGSFRSSAGMQTLHPFSSSSRQQTPAGQPWCTGCGNWTSAGGRGEKGLGSENPAPLPVGPLPVGCFRGGGRGGFCRCGGRMFSIDSAIMEADGHNKGTCLCCWA
ncbi:hypothetical protein LY78DRAFT_211024 [Colletotrichum sublineola]|nr:hypothetical protein LY78DRAFT_211024 [Colletotrichum sublineola]